MLKPYSGKGMKRGLKPAFDVNISLTFAGLHPSCGENHLASCGGWWHVDLTGYF